jgi:hypothetical protein
MVFDPTPPLTVKLFRITIIISTNFKGTILSQSTVPSFTWGTVSDVNLGFDAVLYIRFPDGDNDDVALLKRVNPIPVVSGEAEADVDPCIFIGNLRDESDVTVTVTGGCPNENNVEVKFKKSFQGF